MDLEKLLAAAAQARNGNELAREQIIRHYKPYVLNTVGHICKRYIEWSEEEASIGLIALNKAIDTYDPSKGRTFLNFVYLLINRDLIDFFRKEKNERHLSLYEKNDEEIENKFEVEQSLKQYEKAIQTSLLVEEILELSEELSHYQIAFEELEKFSPKHSDTREMLLDMATELVNCEQCLTYFLEKKQIPVTLFTERTTYKRKTVERHRKYIVTLLLVMLNPNWTHLHEFIQKGGAS